MGLNYFCTQCSSYGTWDRGLGSQQVKRALLNQQSNCAQPELMQKRKDPWRVAREREVRNRAM
eukprot:4647720-Amphidinium_carterae.1